MGRRGCLVWGAVALAIVLPSTGEAQYGERDRTIRVGNKNVLNVGVGYREHDHPTFSETAFFTMGYQRRILRREIRVLPIWLRAGFDFASETVDTEDAYAIWNAGDISGGALPFTEFVQERISDFALRFELLADLVHLPNLAVYGGGGLVVHLVSFSSRGTTSRNTFESRENFLGPSLVGGGRLFMKEKPWAVYGEVRYRRVYGRLDQPPDEIPYFTDQTFEMMSVNAISFEGGLALHW